MTKFGLVLAISLCLLGLLYGTEPATALLQSILDQACDVAGSAVSMLPIHKTKHVAAISSALLFALICIPWEVLIVTTHRTE